MREIDKNKISIIENVRPGSFGNLFLLILLFFPINLVFIFALGFTILSTILYVALMSVALYLLYYNTLRSPRKIKVSKDSIEIEVLDISKFKYKSIHIEKNDIVEISFFIGFSENGILLSTQNRQFKFYLEPNGYYQ